MSDAHTDSLLSIWFENDFVTMAFDKLHFQEWDCMEENQSVTSRQSLSVGWLGYLIMSECGPGPGAGAALSATPGDCAPLSPPRSTSRSPS